MEEGDDRRGGAVSGRGRKVKPSQIRRAARPSCWAGLCYCIRMLGRPASWAVQFVGASSRPAAAVGGLCYRRWRVGLRCCFCCCLRGPEAGGASWAGSVTRARCPFSFSSVFFSFSISYFYPTLCHGFLTLEYMGCQHVYLLGLICAYPHVLTTCLLIVVVY